ncbi:MULTISPECIES: hypothetical protein [unclassified Modicisalibacter]|nr:MULTISPECIES: hypothetical protein [unclassified Modicisalibacter]MBZ9560125.1 hypothetical protein [Modicisalibacter sp. R2A 31.J]MBZ9576033.1 hypothetical protein [Modicisalibacter sp. MOD 31.J]
MTPNHRFPAPGYITGCRWTHFLGDGAANYLPGEMATILVSLDLSMRWA